MTVLWNVTRLPEMFFIKKKITLITLFWRQLNFWMSWCHLNVMTSFECYDVVWSLWRCLNVMTSFECYDVIWMLWRRLIVMMLFECYDVIWMLWRCLNVMTLFECYDVVWKLWCHLNVMTSNERQKDIAVLVSQHTIPLYWNAVSKW